MSSIWRTIRGYILWTYERGSLHYDVMVTVILLFIFVTPHFVNFKDKSPAHRPTGPVTIQPDGRNGYVLQVDAAEIRAQDEAGIHEALQHVLEQYPGDLELVRYEAQRDNRGQVTTFKVWAHR